MNIAIIQSALAELASKGGATFNLAGENLAGRDLYAVSPIKKLEWKSSFAPAVEDVLAYVNHNAGLLATPIAALGLWHEAGLFYMDVVFCVQSRSAAIEIGRAAQQIAVCHLKDGSIIKL
jgi:hypothetical protein